MKSTQSIALLYLLPLALVVYRDAYVFFFPLLLLEQPIYFSLKIGSPLLGNFSFWFNGIVDYWSVNTPNTV